MRILGLFIVGLSASLSLSASVVLDYSLGFGSLPSAQGWTYETFSESESAIYSVAGGKLIETGVGSGLGPFQGIAYYDRLPPTYDPTLPWNLAFTAQVTDDEFGGPIYRQGLASYIFMGGWGYGFGVDRTGISLYDGTYILLSIGTTVHSYNLIGDPVSHIYSILMDGAQVTTGTMSSGSDIWNLGDVTNNHNANAELTSWQISQAPEPATFVLASAALAGLWFRKRRAA